MLYRVDELLLLELLTYVPDNPPFRRILDAAGGTVAQYVNSFDMAAVEDEKDYACLMNGFDWKNIIMAVKKNPSLMKARIAEAHLDTAYGGGGGLSAVFLNDQSGEAVVAFRGTAANEWIDDYVTLEIRVLLKNTTKPIKQIAEELNFPNQSFLGKYFKEHVGMSPSEYRKG